MKDSVYFNIEFISEIERHPHLYDFNLPEYSNRKLVEDTWSNIGHKFNETGHDCKTKWKAIRSAYIRSLNTKHKSSGSRDYYLAGCLKFLIPYTKSKGAQPRRSGSEAEDEGAAAEGSTLALPRIKAEALDAAESDTDASDHSSAPHHSKRQRDHPDRPKRAKAAHGASPCELFLLSIQPHVVSMSEQQQLTFQRGVLDLIDAIKYQPAGGEGPAPADR